MIVLLKGRPVAKAITETLIPRTVMLRQKGICPCLAIIRIGACPDDIAYENSAVKRCGEIGIEVQQIVLQQGICQNELMDVIANINTDPTIHACLLMRPLPEQLDAKAVCSALKPEKDVDGISPGSMAKVYSGSGEGYAPCTAESCMEMLNYYGLNPSGKRAAVIGRSLVIGRPIASLLMAANATVTICHSKTRNMPEIVREADIVVAAVGRAESIGKECFRKDQVVLDVGINWSEVKQKIVGDVDFDEVEPLVSAISPVPGGVGSVTTAILCKHVIEAAECCM